MKNIAVLILLAVTLALGGLYLRESHKTSQGETTIANLQKNVTELEERLSQQETRSANLQTRLRDTHEKVVAKVEEVSHLQQAITNRAESDSTNKNPMAEVFKGVGEMFKNPEMKEFIRNQQKTVLSGMLDKNYAPFFAQLGLTSEQSAALKDLVLNKSLADAGAGMSLMSQQDPTNRTQVFEQAKQEKDAIDEQIKQMLGDDNYKQFQSYEKTIPDRMTIGMFKDQQAAGGSVLTPDQEGQLIQLMSDERQSFKFTTDYSDQSKFAGNLSDNFTEEKMNQFLQEQEQLHQRYLGRAQNFLTTDQYASYEKFLSTQRQMQSMGMKMAAKMFAPKQGGN
jgi:hypothetical protein